MFVDRLLINMSTWFHIFVFLIKIVCVFAQLKFAKIGDNYGPYLSEIENFEQCSGPKLVNLTTYNAEVEKLGDYKYKLLFNITVLTDCKLEKLKIKVYTLKGNSKNILWNYRVEKVCQHYVFSKIIDQIFGGDGCVIKKGNYKAIFNSSELVNQFFGKNFFYGDIYFETVVLSKMGNVFCIISKQRFLRKK